MVYRSQLRLCSHALWRKRVFWVERLQAGGKLIEGTAKRPGNPVGEQRARDDQKDEHASQLDGEIHGFVGDVVVRHGNRDLQRIDAGGRCNGEHLPVVGRGAVFGARDEIARKVADGYDGSAVQIDGVHKGISKRVGGKHHQKLTELKAV